MKDWSIGAEFIRMSCRGQKHSENAISIRSDNTISIKGPIFVLKKYRENFLSVQPG